MYTIIGETKLIVIDEVSDENNLTLYIKPELGMDEVYDTFSSSDLDTILLYNNEGTLYGTRSGYTILGNFMLDNLNNWYAMNLGKHKIADIGVRIDKQEEKVEELFESVFQIQNGELTQQSEYALQVLAATFSDEQALRCILLFPEYKVGVLYKKNERFKYEGKLYKVILEHTSQEDWKPDVEKSLYVNVADPAIEFPDFIKPSGAHDAYMKGNKVTFEGKHYISKVDNNVYSPSEYPSNWELVD